MKALIAFIFLSASITGEKLVGKWQSHPSENGNTTTVQFKADQRFEGFINRKPFVSGSYEVKDSVLWLVDNGCDGKPAEYRLVFFSNDDSLRFIPVTDSCLPRKNGMSRLVLGRVK